MADEPATRWHEDLAFFREAVNFTSAETGFAARLVEKDYFCTVLLQYLANADVGLVFRGGTCLAKVHADFYRLSEDLDFLISTPSDSSRQRRRRTAAPVKAAVAAITDRVPGLQLVDPLSGANESTQYAAMVGYRSLLGEFEESVKIEVGLREPFLTPPVEGGVRTLLLDPVSGAPLVPVAPLSCLSWPEAMAEKMRAALTRRDVAIRDFYDIDYAQRSDDLADVVPLETLRRECRFLGVDPQAFAAIQEAAGGDQATEAGLLAREIV